jgi:hypothetical protein
MSFQIVPAFNPAGSVDAHNEILGGQPGHKLIVIQIYVDLGIKKRSDREQSDSAGHQFTDISFMAQKIGGGDSAVCACDIVYHDGGSELFVKTRGYKPCNCIHGIAGGFRDADGDVMCGFPAGSGR